ncbi:MAG: 5'-nucleotidase C-terminal domain-containing protein [Desulfamplus sp.]|nr:5'-nucleotidase C-terminal domain-containing protein [Desulfamplus sp.]
MKSLRRFKPIIFVLAMSLLPFIYGCFDDDSDSGPLTLSIMHVNDTHSQIEELTSQTIKINGTSTTVDMAGMARLATKVADIRSKKENTLLLHAGDAVQGTLYFTKYEGEAEFRFMNDMKFDAMAIGNHEFDKGPDYLKNFIDYANFPIISANITPSADSELSKQFEPYTIIKVDNQEIGIIGLTTVDTDNISSPGNKVTFTDEIDAAKKYVSELEAKGVNKIIALTHMGYEQEMALGQAVSGIDIIVGGHSHTFLGGKNLTDLGMSVAGDYPTIVKNPSGESVYIVQAWEKAKVLGILDVTFDANGKVTSAAGTPVLLVDDNFKQKDSNGNSVAVDETTKSSIMGVINANSAIEVVKEDATSLATLSTYKAGVDEIQNLKIGSAGDNLYHTRAPFTDKLSVGVPFPFGSYVAPHVAESMLWKVNKSGYKNADIALKGGGGVRISLNKGDITVGKAYELLPFANTLVVVSLTGAEVVESIQSGVTTAVVGTSSGAYPYVAGARYTVDAKTDPKNPMVTLVEIKNDDGTYTKINESANYNVVVDSYVAGGGDFYSTIGNADGYRYDTGFIDAEAFMDYVSEKGTLYRLNETGVTYLTDSKVIKVIETTDIHGSIFPYDFIEAKSTGQSLTQVYSYVKAQRNIANQSVVLLDNGDILQGQPIVNYYNFEHTPLSEHVVAAAMNYMGYDAATVGNHDIEPGKEVYDAIQSALNFPWLAANCIDTNTGKPYFEPYAVVTKNGVKIAILGLITPGIPMWLPQSVWPNMEFIDMTEAAQEWIPKIKSRENPDIIIGLFHSGWDYCYNNDCKSQEEIEAAYALERNENGAQIVAMEVDGFDLICIGHDHMNWADSIKNKAGKTVYFMGADDAAAYISEAIIVVKADGTKMIEVLNRNSSKFAVDNEMYSYFEPQINYTKAFVDEEIGVFTADTSSQDSMFGDSSFNDIIHELQLKVAKNALDIDAQISFAAPLQFDKTIAAGPIYVRDLYKLYKYDNWLYVMELTGEEIDGHLEFSYAKWTNQMKSDKDHLLNFTKLDETVSPPTYETATRYYNYDSAAGIVYTVDVSKPAYDRVEILGLDANLDGVVDPNSTWSETATYNVAINSYRAAGGGGHLTDPNGAGIPANELEDLTIGKTARDLRYYLGEEIEKQGSVTPRAIGNWKFIPEDWAKAGAARDINILYTSGSGAH